MCQNTNENTPENNYINTLFTLFIAITSLLFLGNCKQTYNEKPLVLRIGHAPHDHHSPLYIAAMNPEYFQKNGNIYLKEITYRERYKLMVDSQFVAEVRIARSTGGKEIIQKLQQDQFDMSFGGVPAILHFIDNGSDLQILAPVMAEGDGIFIKNGLPIHDWDSFINYVRQTDKTLRIGYKINFAVQNIIFETALKEEGISFSKDLDDPSAKIILINVHSPKNLLPALKNELIDGFVVNQPYLAIGEYQKLGRIISSLKELPPHGKWDGIPCCVLAGNNKFIKEHPKISTNMVSLLLQANIFVQEQPLRAARQIAEWLNLPVEIEKNSLSTIKFNTVIDENWRKGLDFWINTMIENNRLDGKIKKAQKDKTIDHIILNLEIYNQAQKTSH